MLSPNTKSASPAARSRSKSVASPDASTKEESENVRVICRLRPFNQREIEIHEEQQEKLPEYDRSPIRSVIELDGPQLIFLDHTTWQEKERFAFDQCYWSIPDEIQSCKNSPFAAQDALYEGFGKEMLEQAWKGYHTCFFAYGQTGAGKTFSMMGDPSGENAGFIPRICQQLFRDVERQTAEALEHKDQYVTSFRVEVRYMEIYNEHVSDLLYTQSTLQPELKAKLNFENLRVRSSPATGVFVEHLTSIEVNSWDEMYKFIELGNSSRHTAATKMNERSSRSHAIFKVILTQITTSVPKKQFEKPTEHLRESVINLVDLAGSERNKKTGATGDRLKEAASINKSLSCLKSVIDVLVDNATKRQNKRPPYRDSTLTSLLMDSLGGNSKTFMLVCASPHQDNADETLQSLRYGSRARQIVHSVHVNENATGRMMLELEDELEKMKRELERAKDGHQPETMERLKAQIEEQETQMATYEHQIEEQLNRVQELNEAKQREIASREAMALENLGMLARTRKSRDDARAEYAKLHEKYGTMKKEREELEREHVGAEKDIEKHKGVSDANKKRCSELEQEIEMWRKKTSKLESYRRELEDNSADLNSQLHRLRMERCGAFLRARMRCAQVRLQAKREIENLMEKHEDQLDTIRTNAELDREEMLEGEAEKEAEIDRENKELQDKLDHINAETARIEAERGSQVRQLEAELQQLQAENKRKTKENADRLESAKSEWTATYDRMQNQMRAEYEAAESDWTQRHEEAAENDRQTMEASEKQWARELEATRQQWDTKVDAARREYKQGSEKVKAEWEEKLNASLATNKELRTQIRAIQSKEREYGVMARRVVAVTEQCPKPNAGSSDDYKALWKLLMEYQNEYENNSPSMYKLQHLLREDYLQTRCAAAPLVGVPEASSSIGSPNGDEQRTGRLRPRSPAFRRS